MNDAVALRTRALLRRHRLAVVLLGVTAGLASAIPIAAWGVARRTDSALPTFLDRADPPAVAVSGCPPDYPMPDLSTLSEDEQRAAIAPCLSYDMTADLDDLLSLAEVERASTTSFIVGMVAIPGVGDTPVGAQANGAGLLLAGRQVDPNSPDEFVVSELTARSLPEGVGVGSTVVFTPLLASQAECASDFLCKPGGPAVDLELVGVVRTPGDLAATPASAADGTLFLSPAFWQAHDAERFFSYGTSATLWTADGVSSADLQAAVEARWPGRLMQFEPGLESPVLLLPDAIGYQTRAAAAFAAVTALAALVFVGQALARQARRECRDLPVHATLGMTRKELVLAAVLRSIPPAAIAALVATVTAIALSPIGPIGIARNTLASPSIAVDGWSLAVGAVVVFAVVLIIGAAPALTFPLSLAPNGRAARSNAAAREGRLAGIPLRAPAATGLRAATATRRTGAVPLTTAIIGSALAIAAVLTAAMVTASLDDLLGESANYGVTWDVNVGNNGSREDESAAFARIADVPGVIAAAGMMTGHGVVGEVDLPVVAMVPGPGLPPIDPVVVAGRVPHGPDEIAIGSTTMSELGVGIGDRIAFNVFELPDQPLTALIVGQALVYDGLDGEPGSGGVVDAAWARSLLPGSASQMIAVRLDPASDRRVVLAAIADRFGGADFVKEAEPSHGIKNLARVRNAPWLLAFVMALLAAGALTHALILSVRGRRHELAVLEALGFNRRQVLSSVAWQASFVASIAVVLGVPIGLVGGQWGWRTLARSVGAASPPAGVFWVAVACCLGVLLIANLVAVFPGRSAARQRPARMLRTE